MRVLITRPAQQAHEWVQHLRAAGLDAHALPLIDIVPVPDATQVHAAWSRLASQGMLLFVSPNAAACFFALRPAAAEWPGGLLAASPGPGTTQVLRDLGVTQIVEPAEDAAQFDSESLWQQLAGRDWAGRPVMVIRGTRGRDWLADRLRESGALLSFIAAYQRAVPVLSDAEKALLNQALERPRAHLWFFSSSEAIDHLGTLAPGADWSQARVLATHPRIAERAQRLGAMDVAQVRPAREAVVACIQSIAS